MSQKPFYISRHRNIWYARIIDQQSGRQLSALSTGQKDRDLAIVTVSKWFAEDLPKTKLEPIRHVSEAITINRLFDIVVQVDEDNNY